MGSTDGRAAAIRHARRLTGQVGAITTMVAANRPIGDLAQQIVAARASLDALFFRLIVLELDACPAGEQARPTVDRLLRLALGQHGRRGTPAQTSAGAPR